MEKEMVNIKINGMPLSVPKDSTILEAARYAGIQIPTLCYLKEINAIGACRICVVEVKGAKSLVAACVYPVNEGMEILTHSKKVYASRKITLELILSTHKKECLSCVRSGSCELQQLCKEFGVDDETRYEGANPHYEFDDSAAHMIRDNNKCILCRRCVAACDMQKISVIGANARGFDTHISSAFDKDLADVSCISCGQCIVNCPTGALVEKDDSDKVLAAINDPEKYVIVQTAPSIRATLGECFGMSIGTNVQGKMVAALRRLGFDKVFDTDFAADLTIMEEAHEFIERVQQGGVLPMMLSTLLRIAQFETTISIPELLNGNSTLVRITHDGIVGRVRAFLPFVVAFGSDAGAYFCGRAFGKKQLAPAISPHKTVAGGIGGAVCGAAVALLYGVIVRACGLSANLVSLAAFGLVGSVVAQLGDLTFSAFKRQYGIKDYGNILPGHGGMLDRFDSMYYLAPLTELWMLLLPAISA